MVGAVIMAHGDDHGAILPPRLAPIQVVIVPIWKSDEEQAQVLQAVDRVKAELGDAVRSHADDRDEYKPGWKFNEWELRGVPLRIEIGPKDVAADQVVLARRDVPGRDGKRAVPQAGLSREVCALLDEIQQSLLTRARQFRDEHTQEPTDYDEFKAAVADGFALAPWCGEAACEQAIQDETKATNRGIPLDEGADAGDGRCIRCGQPARERAVFARAY